MLGAPWVACTSFMQVSHVRDMVFECKLTKHIGITEYLIIFGKQDVLAALKIADRITL